LFEPSAAREKMDAASPQAQAGVATTSLVASLLARGRAAGEKVSVAREAAASWTSKRLSEVSAQAELLQQLAGGAYADVKSKGLRVGARDAAGSVQQAVRQWTTLATVKAQDAIAATGDIVTEPVFKTSAVAAAVGGSTLGAVGAASGVVVGGMAGGLAGVPLACFTLGLSIPAGAALGGSAGGALGLASGAAVGFLGGGAVGFAAFKKQRDLRRAGAVAMGKVSDSADYVKGHALASVRCAREAVKDAKQRLIGAGTGGTAESVC